MFRSTDTSAPQATQTVSADGIATPYFMLVQMNNAALLEAYATLDISPRPAKIEEHLYPEDFSLVKAMSGIAFGEEDRSEHPGKLHADAADPIAEAESQTTGQAQDTLSLAAAISGRFATSSGNGGDFGALVQTAMAAAGLPEMDFDPDTHSVGASILAALGAQTSSVPDFAGSAPFTGMRMDYRPETAPMGPKKLVANRHSFEGTHTGSLNLSGTVAAVFNEITKGRRRGAGTGRKVGGGTRQA